MEAPSAPACRVSILVVLDQPPRHPHHVHKASPGFTFQSLLCWISLLDLRVQPIERRPEVGFNPCCAGSASSTSTPWHTTSTWPGFQSLLCWISLLDLVAQARWLPR